MKTEYAITVHQVSDSVLLVFGRDIGLLGSRKVIATRRASTLSGALRKLADDLDKMKSMGIPAMGESNVKG